MSRTPRSTPLGRRTGLIGLGLLFAGFNTGNNLFYLVFTLLAASELVGFLAAGSVLRHVQLEVITPRRGSVGASLRVTLRLRNKSRWLPLPALRWRLRSNRGDEGEVLTPALHAGGSGAATCRLRPGRRGWFDLEAIETETGFPVGLSRRTVRFRPTARTLVLPRATRLHDRGLGKRKGDLKRRAHPRGGGDEPVDARDYRPGDDARTIDWKASARTERLILRERRGESLRALEVRLDRSGNPGPAFEQRVSTAAGAAVSALGRGLPVGFTSDEIELAPGSGPTQRRRILEYLAVVEPRGGSEAP